VQTTGVVTWQTRIASFRFPSCGKEPAAPASISGTPQDRSVAVSFAQAVAPDGYPVESYTVTASPGGATCTTTVGVTPDPLRCTVQGLTNGQPYTFTVRAANEVGDSPESAASASVTPATVPGAPGAVSAVVAAQPGAVDVSWLPPADGGSAITGYTVTASPGGASCTTGSTTCTVAGLSPGATYTMAVTATNAMGTGPAGVSSPVSLAKVNQTAQVSVPKRIKPKGKTTLLKRTVVTSAGQTAKAVVKVRPKGTKYAKVTRSSKGKVVIATKGVRNLRVQLTVSAPATAQANAYLFSKRWTVKVKK
jgi:hypothetical protein